jgi:hypothetical protein
MMLRVMWVRVTGSTVYVFPKQQTGSQLTDERYQAGSFRGTGIGGATAVANTDSDPVHLGQFDERVKAIAAILRHHGIVPTDDSVGIR